MLSYELDAFTNKQKKMTKKKKVCKYSVYLGKKHTKNTKQNKKTKKLKVTPEVGEANGWVWLSNVLLGQDDS